MNVENQGRSTNPTGLALADSAAETLPFPTAPCKTIMPNRQTGSMAWQDASLSLLFGTVAIQTAMTHA